MNIPMLKGKMVEKGVRVDDLAPKIGIDRSTLYRKLQGATVFSLGEVQAIKDALNLTKDEASAIFFD